MGGEKIISLEEKSRLKGNPSTINSFKKALTNYPDKELMDFIEFYGMNPKRLV